MRESRGDLCGGVEVGLIAVRTLSPRRAEMSLRTPEDARAFQCGRRIDLSQFSPKFPVFLTLFSS